MARRIFPLAILYMPNLIKSQKTATSCFLFLLFSLLLFVSYSNSFKASWQLDDKPNILKNHLIQIDKLSTEQLIGATQAKPGSGGFYRPAACVSFALNWYFGKNNVLGYHIVNFLIHLCTAWFLFLTIELLFLTPKLSGRYSPEQIKFIALTASLLWALNPIQTQAVTYIVQRMASMAAMFSIVAIYCYLKARLSNRKKEQAIYLIQAATSYILALLSKENVVAIIIALPVFELLFFQLSLSRKILFKLIGGVVAAAVITGLGGLALRPELFDFISNYYSNRPFTLIERVLTEQRIVVHYLSQLLFPAPSRLSIEHDIILSTSILTPWTTLVAIIVNGSLTLIAIKVYQKHPFISLAILFFYINHLVESTILPLELIFEHRNYLPSFFIFVPMAILLQYAMIKLQKNRLAVNSFIMLVALLFITEGYATYVRNEVWRTEETLWLDAAKKAPNSARPLAVLALKLAWGPNPNEAKYRKALELTKHTLSLRMSREGLDAAQLGNIASIYNKLSEHDKAVVYYRKALDLAPGEANIRYNLCKALIMKGDFQKAKFELENILNNGFIHADYLNLLGFINLKIGQPGQALPFLQQALHYSPNRPDTLLILGKCFSMLGQYDKAKWFFSRARNYGRDDAILALSIIENALSSGATQDADREVRRSIKRFSLPYFLQPLTGPVVNRNREVPLRTEILTPYLQSVLPEISNNLLP